MSGQSREGATVAELLADRLVRAPLERDRVRARLHLLDWLGCALAAGASPSARAMRAVFPALAVRPTGTTDPGKASAAPREAVRRDWAAAAMTLGSLGNVLEMDDVDKRALLHPGPTIVPAALLAAERAGVDDGAMLDAIVRGYEATIRVGRAVGVGHYRFWHNTGTCGPFGAAAAGASVCRLDAARIADAIGLAGSQASGLWQVRHEPASHAKQLHTARATHAGLAGAFLAAEGFIGIRTIFEGEQGFFAAMCPGADPADIIPVTEDWAIHEVSFKPWPACRHAHAAIDAAIAAHDAGIKPAQFDYGEIAVYRDAIRFCDKPEPRDSLSAKFSLQHAVAVSLIYGRPGLAHFEGAGLEDSEVAALRRRLDVVVDPEIDARFPARFGARLRLRSLSGEAFCFDAPDALGDPENPIGEQGIAAKFRMLAARGGVADVQIESVLAAFAAADADGRSDLRDLALGLSLREGAP